MSSNTIPTWCPQRPTIPWDMFQISQDCDLVAKFLRGYYDDNTFPLDQLVNYIRSLRPGFSEFLNDAAAIQWFTQARYCERALAEEYMVTRPIAKCSKEVCLILKWDGNADVAGRGMVVVYIIELVLVFAYLAVFTRSMIFRRSTRFTRTYPIINPRGWDLLIGAFEGSFDTFHSAATLFAIAVLFASLYTNGQTTSGYTIITSLIVSTFTTAVVFATFPIQTESKHRPRMRIIVTITLAILWLIEWCWALTKFGSKKARGDEAWEQICYQKIREQGGNINAGLGALYIIGMIEAGVRGVIGCLVRPGHENRAAKIRRWPWKIISTCYFLLVVLVCIGLFMSQLNMIGKASTEDSAEKQWGFGQILALATWVPVFVEIFYLCFVTPSKVMEDRMPIGWQATVRIEGQSQHDNQPAVYNLVEGHHETKSQNNGTALGVV